MQKGASELEQALAKRRGREEVFESKDDGKASAGYTAGGQLPPWLATAAAMGIEFSPPSNSDADPPWLAAAAESGVVFYDPEGREIKVASSKVQAFKEGLGKVRDFEESCDQPQPAEDLKAAEAETQRRDLKAFVQKLYFRFLRDGLEPNEAAAQAIIQAQQGVQLQESSPDAPQSCGAQSSAQAKHPARAGKEITVR
mmetsp:Transcript_105352/g.187298  ORF Transcript_105352/g.187298 Transcript_105352/m.187298 type:complete len:198 (-) Transcript_105352:203-796(-)